MIMKVIGVIAGAMITGGAGYYLVKEKQDAESRKIYGIGLVVGLVLLVGCGILLAV